MKMSNYVTVKEHIRAGEEVFTGFPGQFLVAPDEDGMYKLVEYVEERDGQRVHIEFDFLKE